MDKIIYSKKYTKEEYAKALKELEAEKNDVGSHPDFEEKWKRMSENIYIEEIPGRREELPRFIEMVKSVCDDYMYDVVIRQCKYGVIVELSLDCTQYMDGRLNRIIGMTDGINVAVGENNRDMTFYLSYGVVGMYCNGSRIFPEEYE